MEKTKEPPSKLWNAQTGENNTVIKEKRLLLREETKQTRKQTKHLFRRLFISKNQSVGSPKCFIQQGNKSNRLFLFFSSV